MYNISQKITSRISQGIKNFQPILQTAFTRDVNEADTVTIIIDILSAVLGYDKYHEITKEFQIRSTYCDLATMIDGKVNLLIEVKAVGVDLKDPQVKQAVDYASNQGIDWVILTNGIIWNIYKLEFTKPIEFTLVYSFNFLELNNKKNKDIELLFPLTKEGSQKSSLQSLHDQKQILSKFTLSAIILSESMVSSILRELRKISNGLKITQEEVSDLLKSEVLKREVIDAEKLKEAVKLFSKKAVKKTKPPVKNEKPDEPQTH